MVAFTNRMPSGFPGRITRSDSLTVETNVIDSAKPPVAFGAFVKLVAGKVQPLETGDDAADVYGVLVNAYPTQSSTNGLNAAATPPALGATDILRRGYISVKLASGSVVKGDAVHVDVATGAISNAGGVTVANATFAGAADANGNVEIAFNI